MSDPIRGRALPELRRRAVALAASGAKRGQICRELDVAPSTAWRWVKQHKERGDAAIDQRIGRPRRLSVRNVEIIAEKLTLGPEANGYDGGLWTQNIIADLIRKTTGASFAPNYVSTLMHGMGWSCQKPERRARERDEEAIRGWVADTWPEIKKKPKE